MVGPGRASSTVDSPMPEPISTISGAARPEIPASVNPGSSTASSGTHHLSAYAVHASCWRGVKRLPRRV